MRREQFRAALAKRLHDLGDGLGALGNNGHETGAFAGTVSKETLQRFAPGIDCERREREGGVVFSEHARPAQNLGDCRGGCVGDPGPHLVAERDQPLERIGLDDLPAAPPSRAAKTDPALHLASLDRSGNLLAKRGFRRPKVVRRAKRQIEKSGVDAADLDTDRPRFAFAQGCGKTGHALDGTWVARLLSQGCRPFC